MVAEGLFREDLLYRINTIHIEVPSLRERKEDIPLLADFFLRRYCEKYSKAKANITSAGLEELYSYNWPGNIRELQHTIEKAVILSEGTTIGPSDLMLRYNTASEIENGNHTLEEMEKQMIMKSIDKNGGNMSSVANQLGITRQTLYNKVKKYGL
jgi:DNA-binding NtrC family response regulator